jgi:hypothetical protein
MAFPSTAGTNAVTLQAALQSAMQIASAVKGQAQNLVSLASAGTLNGQQIANLPAWLNLQNQQLSALSTTSGLAAYAQTQIGNATFDIAAAFVAMQAAITATVQWIVSNFPVDAGGFLAYAKFDGSGNVIFTIFTAAQLAGFIAQLNALITTIN